MRRQRREDEVSEVKMFNWVVGGEAICTLLFNFNWHLPLGWWVAGFLTTKSRQGSEVASMGCRLTWVTWTVRPWNYFFSEFHGSRTSISEKPLTLK